MQVADLRSRGGVLGFGRVRDEVAAIAGHAGRSRELPGQAVGIGREGVCGQGRLLETAVDERVDHRRDRHFVDEGGAVGGRRTHAEEFDACVPAVTVKFDVW